MANNNINCCVYGCHSKQGRDRSLHFHLFPKEKSQTVKVLNAFGQEELVDARRRWEQVLLMGKPVSKYMRVCSKHFTNEDYIGRGFKRVKPRLRKHAVPSQNLPKRRPLGEQERKDTLQPKKLRSQRWKKRQELSYEQIADDLSPLVPVDDPSPEVPESEVVCTQEESQYKREYKDLTEDEKVVLNNLLCLSASESRLQVDEAVQVSSGDIFITFTSTIKTLSHLKSLTGIESYDLLETITKLIGDYYQDKKKHKLPIKDRIILVFMKLKTGIRFNILSFLFQISPSTCKAIFVEYVGYLAEVLERCIHWASFEECQQNIPKCFNAFNKVRIILDCLEIPIEVPKCLCCRIRTYSHYKGRGTLKLMTGVSPAGLITYISKCYGGRASDKAIFLQSNLITKLEPHRDSIMVDKGFLIDQICEENYIKLIRPHFLKKKGQFSEKEAKENILISKARVHVERIIQRMKIFNILKIPLPVSLIPLIDKIIIIISAMVNLQPSILSEDKF